MITAYSIKALEPQIKAAEAAIDQAWQLANEKQLYFQLEQQINTLNQKELELFRNHFNIDCISPQQGIQILQERINEYNQKTAALNSLSGQNISQLVEDYQMDIEGILSFYKEFVMSMETKVVGILEKTEQEAMKELSKEIIKLANSINKKTKMGSAINDLVNITFSAKAQEGKFSLNAFKKANSKSLFSGALKDTTQLTEKLIKNIYAKRKELNRALKKQNKEEFPILNIIIKNNYGDYVSEYAQATGGFATASERTKNKKYDMIPEIDKVAALISSKIGNNFYPEIREFLLKDPAQIYAGRNAKNITGLLGELQGYLYMTIILGREPSSIGWVGGQQREGHQSHTDLTMVLKGEGIEEREIGIQVKNSINDNMIIQFQDMVGLTEDFKSIYYFDKFNVPYEITGPRGSRKAVSGNPPTFTSTRNQIESLREEADRVASLQAAAMMYMDVAEEFSKTGQANRNILYIISGQIFDAATMLTKIRNAIDTRSRSSFVLQAYLKKENRSTIIDDLNDKGFSLIGSEGGAVKNFKLTTSYNFKG